MEGTGRKEDGQQCANRSVPLLRLRELRRSHGLSQADLADLAGVSRGSIYRLENELRGAYPVTVLKLARVLGVPPIELVRERRLAEGEREGR